MDRNSNSESNIRRSSRLNDKKRTTKINYKELEEGKEYIQDLDSYDDPNHRQYEEEVNTKKKKEMKLCHPK